MEFWSKGLGTKQLVLSLGKAEYEVGEEEVVLTGVVESPAEWNYRVTMSRQDLLMVLQMATSPELATFLVHSRGRAPLRSLLFHTLKLVARLAVYSVLPSRRGEPLKATG